MQNLLEARKEEDFLLACSCLVSNQVLSHYFFLEIKITM